MKRLKRKNRQKRVAVIINIANGASARNILAGIFRYVDIGHNWAMQLISNPNDLTKPKLRMLGQTSDGIILVTDVTDEFCRETIKIKVPLSVVDARNPIFGQRTHDIVFVNNDDAAISVAAYRYLSSLGRFNCYGFIPAVNKREWSATREKSFREQVIAHGGKCLTFSGGDAEDAKQDNANLVHWLTALPKPAALMAAWDVRATQVIGAANEAGIGIPDQIAVIGVDNDELFCNSTTPKLSSIQQNQEKAGFTAAAELNRLMRASTKTRSKTIQFPFFKIVERETTKPITPALALVQRAMALIRENAGTASRIDTIANALGCSRRLLEMRFREVSGMTVARTMAFHRLEHIKKVIRESRCSFTKIAAECDFKSASCLSHFFSRQTGCSMKEYRRNSTARGLNRLNSREIANKEKSRMAATHV